jgi:uncharacterized protein
MSLSMYRASVPGFLQTLNALSMILDKADAHCTLKKIDPAVLLATRLYPDMLPLSKQVQLACDFAKNTVARLSGVDLPKFPDHEKTIAELKERIAQVIEAIKLVTPDKVEGTEDKDITFPVGGQPLTLKGEAYLINFALPNFYFHAATAYDILRHCGLEIGKRDFLGRSEGRP